MDNNESPTAALSLSKQLPLALGLGWSAGELVGRYRHGIHPRNPAAGKVGQGWALPRLSYSSRALRSNNDLFWLLAQRLIVLSDELGLDDLEDKEKEGSVDARIRALPAEIRKYIADPSSTSALDPERFYQLLEDWTQLIRLELGVRAQTLPEAFSFAGELADLYWALPVPQRYNLSGWADAWQKLLYKVPRVLEVLGRVKTSLPPYAVVALEHSLKRWQQARPAWLEAEFSQEQARALSGRFGEQARVWGDILQEEKLPQDHLKCSDWLWVGVLSALAFALILLLILLAFSGLVAGASGLLIWVVIPWVQGLLPSVPEPSELVQTPSVSDWLTIGGLLSAAAGLLISAGVWFFRRLGDIYGWLRSQLIPFFVRRRTLVAWRGKLKRP
ncbi:MAG: hypothetical protein WBW48_24675 [Anaerolineae bacterium]